MALISDEVFELTERSEGSIQRPLRDTLTAKSSILANAFSSLFLVRFSSAILMSKWMRSILFMASGDEVRNLSPGRRMNMLLRNRNRSIASRISE